MQAKLSHKARRRKGGVAERELRRLLVDELGDAVSDRNLNQSRSGGHDLLLFDRWIVEVKRQETLCLQTWWTQAVNSAESVSGIPVLAYRASRRPWLFIVPYQILLPDRYEILVDEYFPRSILWTVQMQLEVFCAIVREIESARRLKNMEENKLCTNG